MKNKIVAVTGGIGSGKSAVVKYLAEKGYPTLDCDVLAREVATRPNVIEQVRLLLGNDCITPEGQLDRRAIRSRVFSDEKLLAQYSAIYFGEVKALLRDRVALSGADSDLGAVFVEISVFNAFSFAWDEVWLIESDLNERRRRVAARDGVSEKDVDSIIASQFICESYTLKIDNNGSIDDLKRNVDRALMTV